MNDSGEYTVTAVNNCGQEIAYLEVEVHISKMVDSHTDKIKKSPFSYDLKNTLNFTQDDIIMHDASYLP